MMWTPASERRLGRMSPTGYRTRVRHSPVPGRPRRVLVPVAATAEPLLEQPEVVEAVAVREAASVVAVEVAAAAVGGLRAVLGNLLRHRHLLPRRLVAETASLVTPDE